MGNGETVWHCDGNGGAANCSFRKNCGDALKTEEIHRKLGIDDLEEAFTVQEALVTCGCNELQELEVKLGKLRCLGQRHWAVCALERHRLQAWLGTTGSLPDDA